MLVVCHLHLHVEFGSYVGCVHLQLHVARLGLIFCPCPTYKSLPDRKVPVVVTGSILPLASYVYNLVKPLSLFYLLVQKSINSMILCSTGLLRATLSSFSQAGLASYLDNRNSFFFLPPLGPYISHPA